MIMEQFNALKTELEEELTDNILAYWINFTRDPEPVPVDPRGINP